MPMEPHVTDLSMLSTEREENPLVTKTDSLIKKDMQTLKLKMFNRKGNECWEHKGSCAHRWYQRN